MGLLAWLFGRKSEDKPIAHLPGPGTFSIDIVGESKYQSALESIRGRRTDESQEKIVEAVLAPTENRCWPSWMKSFDERFARHLYLAMTQRFLAERGELLKHATEALMQ